MNLILVILLNLLNFEINPILIDKDLLFDLMNALRLRIM